MRFGTIERGCVPNKHSHNRLRGHFRSKVRSRMKWIAQSALALPVAGKFVCAVLGIILIHVISRLLERRLPNHFHERDMRYRARKAIVFASYLIGLGFIAVLFADRLQQVSFALGVAGAGLVVALQDVVASMAGWFAIGWTNLYRVGDRV